MSLLYFKDSQGRQTIINAEHVVRVIGKSHPKVEVQIRLVDGKIVNVQGGYESGRIWKEFTKQLRSDEKILVEHHRQQEEDAVELQKVKPK